MSKKLVFLGMGGTIAGVASNATDNVGYQAAQIGVDEVLHSIPGLGQVMGDWKLESEQVAQVDSKDIGWGEWCALARRIYVLLVAPDVAAIVVTHGTDTLEETAFFLAQVLPYVLLSGKPVVLTCAMRPASAISPDGPQNVLDAVVVTRSPRACGVLVVCAGTIHSAMSVQKVHPYRLDAFDSGDSGPLGYVEEGLVRWCGEPSSMVVTHKPIAMESLGQVRWPRVEIILNFAGASGAVVRALMEPPNHGDSPVQGIVVAGTGNGSVHRELECALREVQALGIRVRVTTRCAYGKVVRGTTFSGFEPSGGLSAVKARIALILDIMRA